MDVDKTNCEQSCVNEIRKKYQPKEEENYNIIYIIYIYI